ncbi:site-specific DNA-methyltransferase (adenine-specific) [Paraburkholderia fungorum]|uniref:DNA-methyltransferase n=1 Tax=Paraburkholderia fungorum TaxID=134537 RepID=UPI000D40049A|nr:site-specific DNA-methyltransferase [Paraburkholderia fungorum]PRZ56151.1 site-specific DNA-methyltransferase (adenine-specific) [Paraburkholderia fungorum]
MTDWIDKCHFGDCREFLPQMPEGIADACITDPPYGDTSLVWDRRCIGWIDGVSRVLKPAASVWVFGSMRFLAGVFSEMESAGFKYAQDIVWEKQNGSGFHADRFRRVHEHAIQFYRGAWADVYKEPQFTNDARAKNVRRKTRPTHTGHIDAGHYISEDGGPRLVRSVIDVANEHGKALHPTQKPLGILAPLISYSVPPGGLVIDPFFGSGSTGIAAAQLGRHFVGFEDDPASMEMSRVRMCQPGLALEVA